MKKIVRKLLIVLLITISLLSINQIINVKADSGWDSSYSSGSSYSSSSSSSYSSSSSSSGSSVSSYDREFNIDLEPLKECGMVFFIVIQIYFTMVYYIDYIKPFKNILSNDKYTRMSFFIIFGRILFLIIVDLSFGLYAIIESILFLAVVICTKYQYQKLLKKNISQKIKKYQIGNIEELKQELYDKFVKIQEAWMNFDYDNLRKLCNDNIYNTYYEELEALKLKDGKNIMRDFIKIEDKIMCINKNKNIISVEYYLNVEFYDYVINTRTYKREKGNDRIKIHNIYKLTFTKSTKENNICPNCGAPIKSGSTKCSHCKAIIVKDSSEFVLSEKRKIG